MFLRGHLLMLTASENSGIKKAAQQAAWKRSHRQTKSRYPVEFKLQVVRETLAPGASVAAVALRHGINANVIFRWRKEYREGHLGDNTAAAFVPIRVGKDRPVPALPAPNPENPVTAQETTKPESRVEGGLMYLTLPGGFMLRVDADVEEKALRRVLRAVRDFA
jgi:transposase